MANNMSIQVIKKGSWDTIQDNGRRGWQHLGIPVGGSMDTIAAQMANFLVGNSHREAVLEMFLPGPTLRFSAPALIAITGAGRVTASEDIAVDYNRPVFVAEGTTLSWQPTATGRIAYLAIQGGWQLEPWLGSYGTCLGVAASGWQGRPLQKGDVIPFRSSIAPAEGLQETTIRSLPWKHTLSIDKSSPIRLLPDAHLSLLDDHSKGQLISSSFSIHANSNRMSYKLVGSQLSGQRREMISSAVMRGSLQWLPDGGLHIFMADHPTTGGYPRIAQVIAVDLGRLAQWPLNEAVHFEWVTREQAEELLLEQQAYLSTLKNTLHLRLASYLTGSK
jgi:antagonist of KipI